MLSNTYFIYPNCKASCSMRSLHCEVYVLWCIEIELFFRETHETKMLIKSKFFFSLIQTVNVASALFLVEHFQTIPWAQCSFNNIQKWLKYIQRSKSRVKMVSKSLFSSCNSIHSKLISFGSKVISPKDRTIIVRQQCANGFTFQTQFKRSIRQFISPKYFSVIFINLKRKSCFVRHENAAHRLKS